MYKLDFEQLIAWCLTGATRKEWTIAWLMALLAPLLTLHNKFLSFIKMTEIEIKTNGQVCKLEKALNSRFDPGLERIMIEDAEDADIVFAYLASENKPVYLPTFLTAGTGLDFIVKVPSEYAIYIQDIKAFIDHFKLPTTKYTIVYI